MISEKKLEMWIEHNQNVLFIGKHGIGKTAIITQAFQNKGLRYLYFSAATMDPWVDLIGVPKEVVTESGVKYLDLVRPLALAKDEVDAIFIDELNRAAPKVRNAIMELTQFRSINGHKFNNLRFVWAAINPSDEQKTYDVDRLDPAQADRFPIHVNLDYRPDNKFFSDKYGAETAKRAIEWWLGLGITQQEIVSPRRLDYALEWAQKGGDMKDVLPISCNVSQLQNILEDGLVKNRLIAMKKTNDIEGIRRILQNENQFNEALPWIMERQDRKEFFMHLFPPEKMSQALKDSVDDEKTIKAVIKHYYDDEAVREVVQSINAANPSDKLNIVIQNAMPEIMTPNDEALFGTQVVAPHSGNMTCADLVNKLVEVYRKREEFYNNEALTHQHMQDVLNNAPGKLEEQEARLMIGALYILLASLPIAEIESKYMKLFAVLNQSLQTVNVDIRKAEEYLKLRNLLVKKANQPCKYVWVP